MVMRGTRNRDETPQEPLKKVTKEEEEITRLKTTAKQGTSDEESLAVPTKKRTMIFGKKAKTNEDATSEKRKRREQ